jgi:hypothetical protein
MLQTVHMIRRLIDEVIIRISYVECGITIEVSGRLASILALATGEIFPATKYAASGAGEGNRTLVTCLGSKSSTIELRPHVLPLALYSRLAALSSVPHEGTRIGRPI